MYGPDRSTVIHVPQAGGDPLEPGEAVTVHLDWERRYRRMRAHTALHLLSVVLPYPVTGGAIGEGEGRLDFDIPGGRAGQGRTLRKAERPHSARRPRE
jgi:misacylated tRNA(Ala) deacylase